MISRYGREASSSRFSFLMSRHGDPRLPLRLPLCRQCPISGDEDVDACRQCGFAAHRDSCTGIDLRQPISCLLARPDYSRYGACLLRPIRPARSFRFQTPPPVIARPLPTLHEVSGEFALPYAYCPSYHDDADYGQVDAHPPGSQTRLLPRLFRHCAHLRAARHAARVRQAERLT